MAHDGVATLLGDITKPQRDRQDTWTAGAIPVHSGLQIWEEFEDCTARFNITGIMAVSLFLPIA